MSDKRFYDLLGVRPTASDTEIRKAYQEAARRLHPDKGGSREEFQEVKAAYEVLSDPEQREIYDRYGEEALQGGGGGGGFDPFSALFGGMGRGAQRRGPPRGSDHTAAYPITLEDLYNGAAKPLNVIKKVICAACKTASKTPCRECNGQGFKVGMRNLGIGFVQQVRQPCAPCLGTGKVTATKCGQCNGLQVVQETKVLTVNIDKGMGHGQKIKFAGEGDQEPGVLPGDIILVLQQHEHAEFERQGADLWIERTITLVEALCGTSVHVKHLDGRNLIVNHHPGRVIAPGAVLTVKNEGFPRHRSLDKGDLHIKFRIEHRVPSELFGNDDSVQLLRAIMGPAPAPPKFNADEVEEVYLENVDPTRRQADHQGAAHDEDDDEGHGHSHGHGHGGPGVQCGQM